ncbi:MAG TPA: EAL domain-containing protein, partial [Solirubrobacteraceae bacterium]
EAQRLARLGSWEWDISANTVTWSDELWRIYGLEKGSIELSYENFLARVHADDRPSVDERNRKCFADHEPFEDVKRVRRPDGSEFLMRTQGEMIVDAQGHPLRMVGVCEDVTAEIHAREAAAALAAIVQSTDDAVVALDRDGRITSWNPGAERVYGYIREEVIGRPWTMLVPPARHDEERRLVTCILAGEHLDSCDTQRMRSDGTPLDVSLTLSPIHDVRGRIVGVSAISRDVSERTRFERRLAHFADRDALTGLLNRRRFEEEIARQRGRAQRGSAGAVLVLDLDDFKYVNDTHGHQTGDELLRGVARALQRTVRSGDVLARLGGDEFAVLATRADDAEAVAAELLETVRRHLLLAETGPVRVTTSVGVAPFTGGESDETLLAHADRAMYEAKAAGRDRIVVHTAEHGRRARTEAREGWAHRLRLALEHDGFRLHVQPIVDLATGEPVQYEVLLRMRGEGGEDISPGAFLGTAERLGLIGAIDRWVVRQAIALMGEHHRAGRELSLAVNLSGRSIGDPGLVNLVACELAAAGVDPGRLLFEVTETAAIADMEVARRFAAELSALGCRFALDDFGAGFGSFSYLKHIPVDYLKIDGDFVAGPRSETDELVIDAVVAVARGLGKGTIAEWVGDDETLDMLRAKGVDLAQGFHTGRPFPADELAERLAVSVRA